MQKYGRHVDQLHPYSIADCFWQAPQTVAQIYQHRFLRFYTCDNEVCQPRCDTGTQDVDNVLSLTISLKTEDLRAALEADLFSQPQEGRKCPGDIKEEDIKGGEEGRVCPVQKGRVCTRLAALPLKLVVHLKRAQVRVSHSVNALHHHSSAKLYVPVLM